MGVSGKCGVPLSWCTKQADGKLLQFEICCLPAIPDCKRYTKEKISKLSDSLPDSFLWIHHSYVVNVRKVDAYTREQVQINSVNLPISRTYKKNVLETLGRQ